MTTIRATKPQDAAALTALALSSKAHWGYSPEFMAACAKDLAVSTTDCTSGLIKVLESDGAAAGFYQLEGRPPHGRLSNLFVAPEFIGQGIGRTLYNEAIQHARHLGFPQLEITSDPHAEQFYLRMGATRIGATPSGSIPGRVLPLLKAML